MAHPNSPSDLQIKTFQIQNSADERTINEFLAGKIIRHWSASFSPSTSLPSGDGSPLVLGAWNVFVAYENRVDHDTRDNSRLSGRDRERRPMQQDRQRNTRPEMSTPQKSEKAVHEEYKPQIADSDFPLFDAVRKWRNTRAREARVKPYSFFNNKQLEQIVTAKPDSPDSLHTIASDMSPDLWDKYHNELLAFIETARGSSQGALQQLETAKEPA